MLTDQCFATFQGFVYVTADVFFSYHPGKTGFLERFVNAFVDAGEDNPDFFFFRKPDKAFEIVETGGVHKGNFAHADNPDPGLITDGFHAFVKLVGNPEEKRSVDFVYLDFLRNNQFFFFVEDFSFVGEV